jgi:hypothetical protein
MAELNQEKKEWWNRSRKAYALLRTSLTLVIDKLKIAGHPDPDPNFDPKALYDKVHEIIPQVSKQLKDELLMELWTTNVARHPTLHKYLTRALWLRNRLCTLGTTIDNDSMMTILLKGMKESHPRFYEVMKLRKDGDDLELTKLQIHIQKIANEEEYTLSLTSIQKPSNQLSTLSSNLNQNNWNSGNSGNSGNNGNTKDSDSKMIICPTCNY